jgi:hypothetical protein
VGTDDRVHPAAGRIWAGLPSGTRAGLAALPATDLQSLLIDLARVRAGRVNTAQLAHRWREDRFVQPARADPRALTRLEAALWDTLPATFQGLELSPVAPLGTCAALGPVDQNRVVTTMRTSEVVSDPTNVLALEAARRRRSSAEPVHLAACHRVLRAQQFPPGFAAHFSLFALVSSGRDHGSRRTELDFLHRHLQAWTAMVGAVVGDRGFSISYSTYGDRALADQVRTEVGPLHPQLSENPGRRHGLGYYAPLAIKVDRILPDGLVEVGDGGFVGWTADLMADAKERCLVSCISPERLLT